MDIILIRGTENAGKTATAALVYSDLLKKTKVEHYFNRQKVNTNNLTYNDKGDPLDFNAVIIIEGKIVAIISAGDRVWELEANIKIMIDFVKKTFNAEIDILITSGRSLNRKGSVYITLKATYSNSKIDEVWVSHVDKSKKVAEKQKAVNQVISLIG